MTDNSNNHRRMINTARAEINEVDILLHPHRDTSPAIRALEDTALALLDGEELLICRYGMAESGDNGSRLVEFVALTEDGVVTASFRIDDHKPGPVSVRMRRWSHACEWGFVNSVGYSTDGLSPYEDRPDVTTLMVQFAHGEGPLELRAGTPFGTLRFVWDELLRIVKAIREGAATTH